jgi:UDP-2,3-diacylglucosamine pyrophosphatase LpxH
VGIGQAGVRQRIEREFRVDCLALRNQAVQIEAVAAEHVGQHLERREIRAIQPGHAHRDHLRADGPIGIDAE